MLLSGVPFQFTTDPFTKFVPVTCKVTLEALQAGVEVAVPPETVTEVIVGVGGCVIVKAAGAVVPPPGAGVNTVTCAAPAV